MLTFKKFVCFSFISFSLTFCIRNILAKIKINMTTEITNNLNVSLHLIFDSAYFFKSSKLYKSNSMVILMNGKKDLEGINLQCFSRNTTTNVTTVAKVRTAEPGPHCLWTSYIVNCTTVDEPEFFGLSLQKNSPITALHYDYPVKEKYPVIMCYPPMVYESRWQKIIFATEIYHYFGTDLQIQYINSAMTEIVEILKRYALKKWVSIEKFAYFDLNHEDIETIGYQPLLEIAARNQPLAYTKCLTKYRESAEFVIIADVDDVLIPKYANYYLEFQHWKNIFPHAGAFLYYRSAANIFSPPNFKNFSIFDSIKSLKISDTNLVGKSVYQTKNAEVPWIHWPFYGNETTAVIPPTKNKMFHMELVKSSSETFDRIPEHDLSIISSVFKTTFQNFSIWSTKIHNIYAKAISECYSKISAWNNTEKVHTKRPCLTPLYCPKPSYVHGFKCQVAKRNYTANFLNKTIIFYIPNSGYFWHHNKNGCILFND